MYKVTRLMTVFELESLEMSNLLAKLEKKNTIGECFNVVFVNFKEVQFYFDKKIL